LKECHLQYSVLTNQKGNCQMNPNIAQKLAVVFGAGATVIATHTAEKVVFSDTTTQLSFVQNDEVRQAPGIYDVTIAEASATADEVLDGAPMQYELKQVLRSALPETVTPTGKNKSTSAKQSPMMRTDAPVRERR
jgi:hypothetical protein